MDQAPKLGSHCKKLVDLSKIRPSSGLFFLPDEQAFHKGKCLTAACWHQPKIMYGPHFCSHRWCMVEAPPHMWNVFFCTFTSLEFSHVLGSTEAPPNVWINLHSPHELCLSHQFFDLSYLSSKCGAYVPPDLTSWATFSPFQNGSQHTCCHTTFPGICPHPQRADEAISTVAIPYNCSFAREEQLCQGGMRVSLRHSHGSLHHHPNGRPNGGRFPTTSDANLPQRPLGYDG
jgi:hypothetical protein